MIIDKRGTFLKQQKPTRNKYGAIKTCVDGIYYDSCKEASYYKELKLRIAAKEISSLEIHPRYEIRVNGTQVCYVELDFVFNDKIEKRTRYIDVKGRDTQLSRLKRKLIQAQYGINVELV